MKNFLSNVQFPFTFSPGIPEEIIVRWNIA